MRRAAPIAEIKARFAEYVRRAEAGETIVLTRHGRPVARLTSSARDRGTPEPDSLAGTVRESATPYVDPTFDRAHRLARVSREKRREALESFLRESVWSRVPEGRLGRGPTKREREEILGYGSEGV